MLRRCRQQVGLTQTQLGQKLGLGQLLISRGEMGHRKIDIIELYDLCQAMNVSFVEFAQQLDKELNEWEPETDHADIFPEPERTRRPTLKKRP